ncbi:MAG: hypothetical protein IJH63_07145 [Methanobrevibacter sp.]|uniref:Uncharacterized protein n=1 Tax=Methanobrevibacter millerae TaxID=230361 RepID=A0A8T3VCD1_9EURY|nr:hypothetical protein [Methanobrevibacter millerae]MBE6504802.1 hypothetical protein [Methanobrevibacter millerae]MBR0057861.1 hypothetical protein [Methanobrevibacter sp.]MBR0370480.1 hypothetical protein [Methanobrevibacter sp.]
MTKDEKDLIIENLREYLLILEFNDSKNNEQISSLNERISQLENENISLKKEIEHFKSTKAYKLWNLYKK